MKAGSDLTLENIAKMKFSFYGNINTILSERGPAGAAAYVRELGFTGIEAYPGPGLGTVAEAKALKTAMDNEGLTPTCFSACMCLAGEKAAEDEEYLRKFADMAHELGSPYLHHTLVPWTGSVRPGDGEFRKIFDEVVERAGRIADYVAPAGMMCLYEDQGMIFNEPDVVDMFLKAMNRKNTGVCADFGNILMVDGTPEEFIRRNIGRIYNVHIKDLLFKPADAPDPGQGWFRTRSGGYLRHTVPGHGVIDIVGCLRLLLESGYDGWYGFEFDGPESFDWGIRRALENVKRYYEMAGGRL